MNGQQNELQWMPIFIPVLHHMSILLYSKGALTYDTFWFVYVEFNRGGQMCKSRAFVLIGLSAFPIYKNFDSRYVFLVFLLYYTYLHCIRELIDV